MMEESPVSEPCAFRLYVIKDGIRFIACFEVTGIRSRVTSGSIDDPIARLLRGDLLPEVVEQLRAAQEGAYRFVRDVDPSDMFFRSGDLVEVDDLLPAAPLRPFQADKARIGNSHWVKSDAGYLLVTSQGDLLGRIYRGQADGDDRGTWRVQVEGVTQVGHRAGYLGLVTTRSQAKGIIESAYRGVRMFRCRSCQRQSWVEPSFAPGGRCEYSSDVQLCSRCGATSLQELPLDGAPPTRSAGLCRYCREPKPPEFSNTCGKSECQDRDEAREARRLKPKVVRVTKMVLNPGTPFMRIGGAPISYLTLLGIIPKPKLEEETEVRPSKCDNDMYAHYVILSGPKKGWKISVEKTEEEAANAAYRDHLDTLCCHGLPLEDDAPPGSSFPGKDCAACVSENGNSEWEFS
jgi:hypothetical protein